MGRAYDWIRPDHDYNILQGYLKTLFLWTPLVNLVVMSLVGNFDYFWARMYTAQFIGSFVATFCYLSVAFVIVGFRIYDRARGLEPRLHSKFWRMTLSILVMPVGVYLAFPAYNAVAPHVGRRPIAFDLSDYRIGIFIGLLIALLFFLIHTRRDAREAAQAAELRLKTAEAENLRARVSALTAQMNPHLLFNSLNTVASLVGTDPAKAEETVVQLSQLYRGVLSSSQRVVHPLARELEICRSYLAVEHARFGERLRVEVLVGEDVDTESVLVPALSLQPLVENAVKHGLSPRASGGLIQISAAQRDGRVELAVEDDGIGLKAAGARRSLNKGSGTALKNTAERVRLQYGDEGEFSVSERMGGGTAVRISFPAEAAIESVDA